jgi:hypothetical protein
MVQARASRVSRSLSMIWHNWKRRPTWHTSAMQPCMMQKGRKGSVLGHAPAAVRILCGLFSLVSWLPISAQAPQTPLKSIFGIYGLSGASHDSIRITQKGGGKIGVSVKLYYSNGHTCRLNRDGEWREDHVVVVADAIDASQPCKLNAFFEKGRIFLKDDGLQCAPVYCGTRGKLDGVSLPKLNSARK